MPYHHSLDNHRRAAHGASAVMVGDPDHAANDALTNAVDTIANVLHWLAIQPGQDVGSIDSAMRTAHMHFEVEAYGVEA
jgi:hypothetical protein